MAQPILVSISERSPTQLPEEVDLDFVRDWVPLAAIDPRPANSPLQVLEVLDDRFAFHQGGYRKTINIKKDDKPVLFVKRSYLVRAFEDGLAGDEDPDLVQLKVSIRQALEADSIHTVPDPLSFEIVVFRNAAAPEVEWQLLPVVIEVEPPAVLKLGSLSARWQRDVRYCRSALRLTVTMTFDRAGLQFSADAERDGVRRDASDFAIGTTNIEKQTMVVVDIGYPKPGFDPFILDLALTAPIANVLQLIQQFGVEHQNECQLSLACDVKATFEQGGHVTDLPIPNSHREAPYRADLRRRLFVRCDKHEIDLLTSRSPASLGPIVIGVRGTIFDRAVIELAVTSMPKRVNARISGSVKLFDEASQTLVGPEKRLIGQTAMVEDVRVGRAQLRLSLADYRIPERFLPSSETGPRKFRAELSIVLAAGGSEDSYACNLNLTLTPRRALRPICIDIGTSATAVWIASATGNNVSRQYRALPLGKWLEEIDEWHAESRRITGVKDSVLIPSHVGLTWREGLRTRHNPQSLGDVMLALNENTADRLAFLDRTYDISVPFPSSSMLAAAGEGVFKRLKGALAEGVREVSLDIAIDRRNRQTDKVVRTQKLEIKRLLEDYVDELLKFYVLREIATKLDGDAGEIDDAMRGAQFIMTYPCGVSHELRRAYQDAVVDMIRRFVPDPDDFVEPLFFTESFAAGRHALQLLVDEGNPVVTAQDEAIVVALDIGAGTFDISIFQHNAPSRATPLVDFGLPIGGDVLDRALIARVSDILKTVLEHDQVKHVLALNDGDPAAYEAALESEVRSAKIGLSAACSKFEDFGWTRQTTFKIKLMDVEQGRKSLPLVRVKDADTHDNQPVNVIVGGQSVVLELRVSGASNAAVTLEIPRDLLDGTQARDLAQVVNVLGRVLPDVAVEVALQLRKAEGSTPQPLLVIVTGRTSLWPPLFQAIRETVEKHGFAIFARRKPFDPQVMKSAVVLGAAVSQSGTSGSIVQTARPNPLAIIRTASRFQPNAGLGQSGIARTVIEGIDYLTGYSSDRMPRRGYSVKTPVSLKGQFFLVRAIPGLDDVERLKLLNAVLASPPIFDFNGQTGFHATDFGLGASAPNHDGEVIVDIDAEGVMKVTITARNSSAHQSLSILGDDVVRTHV